MNFKNAVILRDALNKSSIRSFPVHIGILCVNDKESGGFELRSEHSWRNSHVNRIRTFFPSHVKGMTDDEINKIKKDDYKFFNLIYGGRLGNGKNEGYLYRGRAWPQITFKSNYRRLSTPEYDLVKDPDLLLRDAKIAASVCVAFYEKGFDAAFKNKKFKESHGIESFSDITTDNQAILACAHITAGIGKSVTGKVVTRAFDNAFRSYEKILDFYWNFTG